jgi:hypothetical protein
MKGVTNKKITKILDEMIANKTDAIKIDNSEGTFMPFNIDYLDRYGNLHHFAFSHYYKHESGDMIADPDMEILYDDIFYKVMYPVTYQDSFGYQEAIDWNTGNYQPKKQAQLATFLRKWLSNVVNQQNL